MNHKSGRKVRVNTTLLPPCRGPHCLACREPLSRLCFPISHSMQLKMSLVNGNSQSVAMVCQHNCTFFCGGPYKMTYKQTNRYLQTPAAAKQDNSKCSDCFVPVIHPHILSQYNFFLEGLSQCLFVYKYVQLLKIIRIIHSVQFLYKHLLMRGSCFIYSLRN